MKHANSVLDWGLSKDKGGGIKGKIRLVVVGFLFSFEPWCAKCKTHPVSVSSSNPCVVVQSLCWVPIWTFDLRGKIANFAEITRK